MKARVFAYRYLAGKPLDGKQRGNATYFRPATSPTNAVLKRWHSRPGYQRTLYRLAVPASFVGTAVAYADHPTLTGTSLATAGTVYGYRKLRKMHESWRTRVFRRIYVRPVSRALAPVLNIPDSLPVDQWLYLSPDLSSESAIVPKRLSPAEQWVADQYASRFEPVMRWLPDRLMRVRWTCQRWLSPINARLEFFRRPGPDLTRLKVRITVPNQFIDNELRKRVREIISAKVGIYDMVESWAQIGSDAIGTYETQERPPTTVGYSDVLAILPTLKDTEYYLGNGARNRPVIVDLDDDSPHIALSAGSGAGKSVLAKLVAVQTLNRGGRVIILDRKGSHRWALNLPGVEYHTQAEAMNVALCEMAELADKRNRQALAEDEGWNPGQRILIIAEELNATMSMLKTWWDAVRDKSDPRLCPGIAAFREIMYMGRSAHINLLAVAQMLTALTTGGPESRENFGIRMLSRYTANNWKMLAPEVAMPRKSKVRGRWQIVVAGSATETQVAYLTDPQARELSGMTVSRTERLSTSVTEIGAMGVWKHSGEEIIPTVTVPHLEGGISISEALLHGIIVGSYEAVKKRLSRDENAPEPTGRRGNIRLYDADELAEWVGVKLIRADK